MICVIAFCKAVIIYVLWAGTDTEVAQTAVSMAFTIIGTTLAAYVFGATYEDVKMKAK